MNKAVLADVVELTRHIVNHYFQGDPAPWFNCLAPKSVFMAPGEDILFGAENIKRRMLKYAQHGRGRMIRQEYFHIPLDSRAAIVAAYTVSARQSDDNYRIISLYTFVWQLIGNETKLVYEHTSYEYYKDEDQKSRSGLIMDVNTLQFVKQLLMDTPRQEKLSITDGGQTFFLDTKTLLFVQASGNGTDLHCIDRVLRTTKKLKEMKECLSDDFYQIHRSYIINSRYLVGLSCYEAELIPGVKLPIPASSYGKVKKDLEEKLGRSLKKSRALQ